ncbi:MAG: LysE family transporter [Methylobacterium sp.]|nr:LysE family transporter [Methylobacterium sp.]MCA3600492.1 LysE family transporter [Methylobacterium sp.]MCA3604596.1 LysE family transporter [Methylobacterium sp.]MCA3614043.1 LysE family transporter [Methylobacterium sp.]MCA3624179.1 LysE family transporter [Methylobacterium sp.]
MPELSTLAILLAAAFLSTASPGPATLMIAGTAMQQGRLFGLATASGVLTGSLIWSVAAAMGMAALMLRHVWLLEALRYAGAAYLLYLAWRSARSALRPTPDQALPAMAGSLRKAYLRGLALHLTNPKAILFFGSLYAIGLPAETSPAGLMAVIAAIGLQSFLIFHGYALVFSTPAIARGYAGMRRGFEAAFAMLFGYAGLKVLLARS